jgi:hypothetical protein
MQADFENRVSDVFWRLDISGAKVINFQVVEP